MDVAVRALKNLHTCKILTLLLLLKKQIQYMETLKINTVKAIGCMGVGKKCVVVVKNILLIWPREFKYVMNG